GTSALSDAVRESFFKLMSYKDEYEVARLYTNGEFRQKLARQFDGDYTLTFHMAPPLAARRDPTTGKLQKTTFGPWMMKALGFIAKFKGLRGGAFDIFGRTEERRMERALIDEYEQTMLDLAGALNADNHATAVALARLPLTIRGFGHIKEANAKKAAAERQRLLQAFRSPEVLKTAAE
ncbi:MAG: indolepyruvate ferredoxin oxidoreductase family protein, partial [Hyphomicrobiales bacterium]|nr:indolepyruvate ferredoxin oxidoreductase family protein [Hyphomicrobiales bacterium]